jgi:hypothetical protein
MPKAIAEDWGTAKRRWEAWWQCSLYDRPLLLVTAPKDEMAVDEGKVEIADRNPVTSWSDADHIIRRGKASIRNTWFAGEVLPVLNPNWSVGHTCYFGCKPEFHPGTVWVSPLACEADGFPKIHFNPEGYWWRWFKGFAEQALGQSEGLYYLVPQFGNGAVDTLAMMRGSQQLMLDLAENPDWVKRSVDSITEMLLERFACLWPGIDNSGMDGYLNWIGCWSPGRTFLMDADISGMVSPQHFGAIFLPSIARHMQSVEYRCFHIDGIALAKAHLDTLLDLPELQSFQWVPGDGRTEILQWVPLIQKIQSKKKAVFLNATPLEVLPLLKEVHPEGLCISVRCENESSARRLIETVAKQF